MSKPAIIFFDPKAKTQPLPDFTAADVEEGTKVQRGLTLFHDDRIGVTAGLWEAGPSLSPWINYPADDVSLCLEGEIIVIEEGKETRAGPGECMVIPKGTRCRYKQESHVRKFYMCWGNLADQVAPSGKSAIKIDPNIMLSPSTPPTIDLLLSTVPTQHAHEFFADDSGQFTLGVWQTTGYHRKLIDFPRHELMHLLEGQVTMIDDNGNEQTFKAGDTFFVPMGTPNAWKSEGTLRKIYCIFQPAARTA